MDYASFQTSIAKIDEAKKVYTKALAKEKKTKETHDTAKAELKVAERGYVNALEEAKRVVSPEETERVISPRAISP